MFLRMDELKMNNKAVSKLKNRNINILLKLRTTQNTNRQVGSRHPFFNGLTTLSGMPNLLKKSAWIMIFMITINKMTKE